MVGLDLVGILHRDVAHEPARGRPSLELGRTFLELGRPVDALGAARQALALGDRTLRDQALRLTVEAAERAGRWDDAARARGVLEAEGRSGPSRPQ